MDATTEYATPLSLTDLIFFVVTLVASGMYPNLVPVKSDI